MHDAHNLFERQDPQVQVLSHKADPDTSKEAAQKMVENGKLNRQEQLVLIEIIRVTKNMNCLNECNRNFTARELAMWSNILNYFTIQRRLSGLYRKDKIERLAEDGSVWFENCGKKKMVRDGCCVWRLI